MRKTATRVLALACIALLAVQTMGLHLHVDAAGNGQGLHGTHPHHGHSDHGHDLDLDGSKLELGNVWSKTVAPPITVPFALEVPVADRAGSWPILSKPDIPESPRRWRPPLRAPPLTA